MALLFMSALYGGSLSLRGQLLLDALQFPPFSGNLLRRFAAGTIVLYKKVNPANRSQRGV